MKTKRIHDECSFKHHFRWRAERVVNNLTEKMHMNDQLVPATTCWLINEVLDELWHTYEDFDLINEVDQ